MGGGADAGQAALVWAQELWGDLIPPCAKDRPSDSPAADYRLGCVDLATAPPQPPPHPPPPEACWCPLLTGHAASATPTESGLSCALVLGYLAIRHSHVPALITMMVSPGEGG